YDEARTCILSAANKEFKAFQVLMGHTYAAQQNFPEAIKWYKRALDNNRANLAEIKEYPRWAPDNFEKQYAILHYRHNGGFGSKKNYNYHTGKHAVMTNIGLYYLYGKDGIEKNEQEAFQWLMKAADDAVPVAVYAEEIKKNKSV